MKRLLVFPLTMLIAFAISGLFKRHSMHLTHIAPSDEKVGEWRGYTYQQHTDARFSIDGVVTSISPNGGAFCSGPLQGGPGLSFTLKEGDGSRRKAREHSFAAFGDEATEPVMKSLGVGSHVRLSGTSGAVIISKEGQVVQRVEPTGHWYSMIQQDVLFVRQVDRL